MPWPHGLGNWPHDIVILITGEVVRGCEHYSVNPPLYMSENARDTFCRLKIISFSLRKNLIFIKEKKVETKA